MKYYLTVLHHQITHDPAEDTSVCVCVCVCVEGTSVETLGRDHECISIGLCYWSEHKQSSNLKRIITPVCRKQTDFLINCS